MSFAVSSPEAASLGEAPSDGLASSWVEANQADLCAHLGRVRSHLEAHLRRLQGGADESASTSSTCATDANAAVPAADSAFALGRIVDACGLSDFERDVLLLCAGVELDASVAALCARLQSPIAEPEQVDEAKAWATFGLALSALPGAHWSALQPSAPLREWRLVNLAGATQVLAATSMQSSLTLSPLRIDERILHALCGLDAPDEALRNLLEELPQAPHLSDSQLELCRVAANVWAGHELPLLLLHEADARTRRNIAAGLCAELGCEGSLMALESWPQDERESALLWRLWEREVVLGARVLVLESEGGEDEAVRLRALARHARRRSLPIVLLSPRRADVSSWHTGGAVAFEVARPTAEEQSGLWRAALQDALPEETIAHINGHLESCVEEVSMHFDVSPTVIESAAREAAGLLATRGPSGDAAAADDVCKYLWGACRRQARPHLDELAQRLEGRSTWKDLVLPEGSASILRDIAGHVQKRAQVYGRWGFGARGSRGLGMSALFAGPSGTGKTLAAEVLGNALDLDVYRIDLSTTVSKYIGETEKNLARIFDAAEQGGAILLFDEADALFGKRSEVKDSHDRHANVEVGFLLQRMESYRGLAILTTNLKSSLDVAFLRRLRFVVEFPFPDATQRAEIWRRSFPAEAPREDVDEKKLARLAIAGGNIRNMVLNAAFLAADAGAPIRMEHLLRAAQSEYAKLEKTLTEAEVRGWV